MITALTAVALLPLLAVFAGTSALPLLLLPAAMLIPGIIMRSRETPPEPPAEEGGGDGGSPLDPTLPGGGGGAPLLDAEQPRHRLRGPGRAVWASPHRRPTHAPGEAPARPAVAPRR